MINLAIDISLNQMIGNRFQETEDKDFFRDIVAIWSQVAAKDSNLQAVYWELPLQHDFRPWRLCISINCLFQNSLREFWESDIFNFELLCILRPSENFWRYFNPRQRRSVTVCPQIAVRQIDWPMRTGCSVMWWSHGHCVFQSNIHKYSIYSSVKD